MERVRFVCKNCGKEFVSEVCGREEARERNISLSPIRCPRCNSTNIVRT